MKARPLISVVIPVYNGERYLAQAIESVLAQTYQPIEVIVLDDGSSDGSAGIAQRFSGLRYCFQPNAGLGAARNRGIELSEGSFLAFLDADDLWVADKLTRQMAFFDADPALEMVFGHTRQFYSPELGDAIKTKITHAGEIMPGHLAGTLLIKRESFYRVGTFATDWRVGEFMDWYMRAVELGLKCSMVPEVLLERRLHAANMGIRERRARNDYARILKSSLDRRRAKRKTQG
jgi:glycosyltransferase involved in cell wall biosynthesis